MVTSKKAALSLLIAVILFGIFSFFAFTGLFDLLQTHFYNPAIINNIIRDNARNAEFIDKFLSDMNDRFSETLKTGEVRRSFLSSQSQDDIDARSRIYSLLIRSFEGIEWVRFIESGGRRLLYSSNSYDILNQDEAFPVYRNYDDSDFPYELISVKEGGQAKFTFDSKFDRILFSYPLYDSFDIYWGTALFSLSMDSVLSLLINQGRIRFSQDIMMISNPAGFVFGNYTAGETALPSQISAIWADGQGEERQRTLLVSPSSGLLMILVTAKTSQGFYIGKLADEMQFSFTLTMKIILLASFFFTVLLVIFLLFSLRQDPVTIVQNRLKQLQVSIFDQFYELKGEADWKRWSRELDNRRGEINTQIKRGLKFSPENSSEIDVLIDRSWDELLTVIGRRSEAEIDEGKLKEIFSSIVSSLPGANQWSGAPGPTVVAVPKQAKKAGLLMKASAFIQKVDDAELVSETHELEELESVDDAEAAKYLDEDIITQETLEAQLPMEDINFLASQIEFSPSQETETDSATDVSIKDNLEIVSPFSDMLHDLSSDDTVDIDIIEERGGIPFISEDIKNADSETTDEINKDFKDLVDSVIK